MPRIFTSANDPLDFCGRCMPGEVVAKKRYFNLGNGPDDRGNCFEYNAEHPPYENENYRCTTCKRNLGEKDNECTR